MPRVTRSQTQKAFVGNQAFDIDSIPFEVSGAPSPVVPMTPQVKKSTIVRQTPAKPVYQTPAKPSPNIRMTRTQNQKRAASPEIEIIDGPPAAKLPRTAKGVSGPESA